MKTISDYTIYCTPEQTRKALELGAPIYVYDKRNSDAIRELDVTLENKVELSNGLYAEIPTAEQMVGWLEEQLKQKQYDAFDITISIEYSYDKDWGYFFGIEHFFNFNSRQEATLAAIDAALEYLTNNKK